MGLVPVESVRHRLKADVGDSLFGSPGSGRGEIRGRYATVMGFEVRAMGAKRGWYRGRLTFRP